MPTIVNDDSIIEVPLKNISIDCAKEYYEEILCNRAIPDIRDGLMKVQRRILWAELVNNWTHEKAHIKSARVIGEVIGVWHPHGTDATYEASAIMSQVWKNHIPLIEFHGISGSISGSGPAAMRYTEQRMAKITKTLMMSNIKDNAVDMVKNFSQDDDEPVILPAKIPMILINGSFGIASGYMCSIPLHNPREVLIELINRLKDPNYDVNLLPDFPTGSILCNSNRISNVYKDFTKAIEKDKDSKLVVRCKIEKDEKNHKIYITEIPYGISVNRIINSIVDATKSNDDKSKKKSLSSNNEIITGISNVKNLTSGKMDVKIKIWCKKGYDLDTIISQLYRFTLCQTSIPICFNLCLGNKFLSYDMIKNINNLMDMLIDFNRETIKRVKIEFIRKKKFRCHIINGLLIILRDNDINKVIKKIQKCNSKSEVIHMLMNDYELDEIQATNLAEYKLYQLAKFVIDDLVNELKTLENEIEDESEYLRDPNKLKKFMINEYKELLKNEFTEKKYPRRTTLENINVNNKESLIVESIPDEDFMLICTNNGYIKKIPIIKKQGRKTQGSNIGKIKENDFVTKSLIINSRSNLLAFTNSGKVYNFKAYDIPICKNINTYGYDLSRSLNNEKLINLVSVTDEEIDNNECSILMATRYNKVKITNISEFKNVYSNGIIAISIRSKTNKNGLPNNDELICAEKINKDSNSILALCNNGNAIRVLLDNIPNVKRITEGSNLFTPTIISNGYEVKNVCVINDNDEYLFYISSKGLGKIISINEFNETNYRGTKGKMIAKIRDNDHAEKVIPISLNDSILVISNKKMINVSTDKMSIIGRVTYGYTIKECDKDEHVIDCVNVIYKD